MDARKKALDHFRKQLRSDSRGSEMPMKKVSVMADSEEGLIEGLEKAEDIVEDGAEAVSQDIASEMMDEMGDEEMMDEEYASEEEEAFDLDSMTPEEMKEMILALKNK
jgi:hypothetical protein